MSKKKAGVLVFFGMTCIQISIVVTIFYSLTFGLLLFGFGVLVAWKGFSRLAKEAPQKPKKRSSRSWHAILEVEESATKEEVIAAYRKLAKKYHPDTAGDGKGNPVAFRKVNRAYEIGKRRAASRTGTQQQTFH